MFRFASPSFLLLLATVPLLLWVRRRNHRLPAMTVSALFPLAGLRKSAVLQMEWLLPALKYAAVCLIVVALARPQWGTQKTTVTSSGINIVLAVDLSESMAALDFKLNGNIVNRLTAVKEVVRKFISGRAGDRIGMVVFGSHAYTQLPLTRDYDAIVSVLDRLKIGSAGKSTAIGDAMGISIKRLADVESKSNIIILLTDGRSNAGEVSPAAAWTIAGEKGVKIYTIGVGSTGRVPFPVNDPVFGQRTIYRRVDMDEETLKAIAEKTGGRYFRAEGMDSLQQVYETIDRLEKSDVQTDLYAAYREMYGWFLVPSLAAVSLWVGFRNTRFLRVP